MFFAPGSDSIAALAAAAGATFLTGQVLMVDGGMQYHR